MDDLSDDPLADDPAFASWPAEVREAWANLELPSLRDVLASQERLAAEVRRQNQELRRLGQAAPAPAPAGSDAQAIAAALAEARALGGRLAAASASGLIALAESADRHAGALDTAIQSLLVRPAGRSWWGGAVAYSAEARAALAAQVEGARLVRDKARQALADAGLVRIAPVPGATFEPEMHRATATARGPAGRIVELVREGWRDGGNVVRPAEVTVGNNPHPTVEHP